MTDIRDWINEHGASLGIELKEGDILTNVVTLICIQRLTDTDQALVIGTTENTGGITQYGLICAAKLQVEDWLVNGDGSDDE